MKKLIQLCFVLTATALITAAADRPNIVLIMVDDLGYSDFGCYGSEIKTPNIDVLAEGGLRFSRFYNTAKCHSSRVSLLTGLYCNQAGAESLNRGVTIAEVLGKAGYSTAMVGKWHLHKEPTDRGFGKYFGHLSGATNFFTGDDTFRLNGKKWDDFDDDFYTTDAWGAYSKQFLGEMLEEKPDAPFFLYIAHNAPHYPLHVRQEDYDKYSGRYDRGWDVIRTERQEKQRKMNLYPEGWDLAPRPKNVPEWDTLSNEGKGWESNRMAAFAGMVDRVDQVTGDLVAYLKEQGKYENTLILICSDNGACPFDRTRGKDHDPWNAESYWCYDTGWSHVGNTPFRLHKQNQHQGGISSPMIAHWPAGIAAEERGKITDQVGHLIDFMATAIDVAETEYPKEWPGIELEPLQGKSLVPIFQGETREPHADLYFQFATNRAIRQGKWKLVSHRRAKWELYDMEADGTEMHDLADEKPELVEKLAKRWHELAELDRLKAQNAAPVTDKEPPLLKKDGRPEGGGQGKKANAKKKGKEKESGAK
ncbi:MAG: arylsulfatase [Verrucomicrobiales bacterium]|nr:arylsulfatase [Verrucomicrobiales bacterium]